MKRMLFVSVGLLFFGIARAHVDSSVNINTANVKQLITLALKNRKRLLLVENTRVFFIRLMI